MKGKNQSTVDWGEHRTTTLTPTKNGSEQGACETARENTRLTSEKGRVPSYALNYGATLLRERAHVCG